MSNKRKTLTSHAWEKIYNKWDEENEFLDNDQDEYESHIEERGS